MRGVIAVPRAAGVTRHRDPGVTRALGVLLLVRVSLRACGFARTLRVVSRLTARPVAAATASSRVHGIERAVATAAALFPGRALCLEQSLALYVLLRRSGIDARLRFGVQPYPFGAHAWVECGGEPVNDIREHVAFYAPLPDVLP